MVAPYPADLLRPTLTFLPTKPTDRSLGEVHFACDHREAVRFFRLFPHTGVCLMPTSPNSSFPFGSEFGFVAICPRLVSLAAALGASFAPSNLISPGDC